MKTAMFAISASVMSRQRRSSCLVGLCERHRGPNAVLITSTRTRTPSLPAQGRDERKSILESDRNDRQSARWLSFAADGSGWPTMGQSSRLSIPWDIVPCC
jgi:hypothetical protein